MEDSEARRVQSTETVDTSKPQIGGFGANFGFSRESTFAALASGSGAATTSGFGGASGTLSGAVDYKLGYYGEKNDDFTVLPNKWTGKEIEDK